MAKKATKGKGFNMSAAVREVLSENRKLTAREVEAEVRKRNPKASINSNSLSVAFTNARQKLGIAKKRKSVRKRKPSSAAAARTAGQLDMSALQAARKFVAEVGDADKAMEAVRQLKTLQID